MARRLSFPQTLSLIHLGTPCTRRQNVAPRLRATGLPYIANPEIMSSGNAQHIGTETTALFKVQAGIQLQITTTARRGGTWGAATPCTFFISHSGLDSTKYTTAAERRGDGTPLHRDTAGTRPSSRSTAQSTLRVQLLLHLA